MRRAVFVDRDGTMGQNANVMVPTQLVPFPALGDAVKRLQAAGFLVIVITNQSCIARGMDGGYDFTAEFCRYGFDDWFICPHREEDGCDCRKPKPGLLLQADKKYQIDFSASYMIGDRWTDLAAGHDLGCRGVLVLTGRGKESASMPNAFPADHITKDIFSAVQWICDHERSSSEKT